MWVALQARGKRERNGGKQEEIFLINICTFAAVSLKIEQS